ncbi:sensor histidine kinase [Actinomadura atramentaria]|uniref:sensor histidine kinase n=1 Tax=Actinomadura atramentaria TaxID=1990 RepID=UPI000A00AC57|nr:histidine kinase [Actinomadura atramentaria]
MNVGDGVRGLARRPSRRAVALDALLLAVLEFPPVTADLVVVRPHEAHWWAQLAGVVLLGVAVLACRAAPLLSLVVVVALTAVHGNFAFGLPVMAYLTGLRTARSRPVLWTFTVIVVGGTVMNLLRGADITTWFALTVWLVLLGVLPWLAGHYWRQDRELVRAGWDRAARLEREQRIAAERERLRERSRIARDMHDSLGHELALLAVRAGALQVAPGLADEHRRAAADLRAGAAAATERLQEIIGVLRADADASVRPARESVADLVARARASGVPVRLTGDDAPLDLAPMAALAVHRVVQEALTNAAKHAPGAPITVHLARPTRDTVTVTITNAPPTTPAPSAPAPGALAPDALAPGGLASGRHAPGAPAPGGHEPDAPVPDGLATDGLASGGFGLVGLAERVRLAGGALRTGPTPSGGFEVTANLPCAPGAVSPDARRPAPGTSGPGAADPGGDGFHAADLGAADPGADESESARRLARERRAVRRSLATAIVVPALLLAALSAVMAGYYAVATLNSSLPPDRFTALRIGADRAAVLRDAPPMQLVNRESVRARHPEPRGTDCRYYRSDVNLLGLGDVYRLCFAGGRLAAKDVLRQ